MNLLRRDAYSAENVFYQSIYDSSYIGILPLYPNFIQDMFRKLVNAALMLNQLLRMMRLVDCDQLQTLCATTISYVKFLFYVYVKCELTLNYLVMFLHASICRG